MARKLELWRSDSAGEFSRVCREARLGGAKVGFVPTMGALHEGHLSLIREARRQGCDFLAVSIFVNPLQFGPTEDLSRYPRTLVHDLELCAQEGVDAVFHPTVDGFYPADFVSRVRVGGLSETLEGAHRPGHFDGVTTVVAKLFGIVGESTACFGRKDYQQWRIIERMVEDLNYPVRVVGCPIVREEDGLALSSRNRYLSEQERKQALGLSQALFQARHAWDQGRRDVAKIREEAEALLSSTVDRVEYVECLHPEKLESLAEATGDQALIAIAAWVGQTRLIDNSVLGQNDFAFGATQPESS